MHGVAVFAGGAIAAAVRMLLSILLMLIFVPGYSGIAEVPRLRSTGRMSITPVLLDRSDPARRQLGRLHFLGGVQLSSSDPAFGGFSSMTIRNGRVTLLSDGGNAVAFDLDDRWRMRRLAFANLPDGPGTGWEKRDRDSESMTMNAATGQVWVGFENHNAIWRYAPALRSAQRGIEPPQMADWPLNGGPEAMVRLRSGAFIVLCETASWPGAKGRAALWFAQDPTRDDRHGFRFAYMPPAGFDPSDMTELPNGDLLVLNRAFGFPYVFTAKLTLVQRAAIRAGRLVGGTVIASFAAPIIHDNFEALATTQEHGETIVWIASDDNQSVLQRSLLLKFRLDPPQTGG